MRVKRLEIDNSCAMRQNINLIYRIVIICHKNSRKSVHQITIICNITQCVL